MNQGYYIGVDIANMSLSNLIVMLVGVILLVVLVPVVLIVAVRKLGIRSLGPIKMERRGQAVEHYTNERIRAIDDSCRKQMQQHTSRIKRSVHNMFSEMDVDVLARLAISSVIKSPMYESIANNHFTTELMPENFDGYRERIIKTVKDEYVSIARASLVGSYGRSPLPTWEESRERLTERVDEWLDMVCKEVIDACCKSVGFV